jgi:hypothetical protein
MEITPKQLALLEMISDPMCAFFCDHNTPDLAELRDAGMVEMIIGQGQRWKLTAQGKAQLERYTVIGICSLCRAPQRLLGTDTVVCEQGHADKPTKTPCSVCAELDTVGLKPSCKQGFDIDPPPAKRCEYWRFAGHEAARRAAVGVWDA